MHKNKTVDTHRFAMTPRAEIPRSKFKIQKTHKTTFDAGYLVPVYVDEVLPGDTMSVRMTAFARLATPLFPLMDNLHLESFFFFVPNRLVWANWKRMMGEQDNPTDTIDYVVPFVSPNGTPSDGYDVGGVADYFGLPTVGQVAVGQGQNITANALPFRAYNLIYNEWFRDENLQQSALVPKDDQASFESTFPLRRRGKRHDYFTSCLPWPQKGQSASIALGSSVPVIPDPAGSVPTFSSGVGISSLSVQSNSSITATDPALAGGQARTNLAWSDPGLVADLSEATSVTINALRQSFAVQKLMERDARGGTRYTEIVRSHFGVVSPDARLQRPEYLGGGHSPIVINPIAQTSATAYGEQASGPLGTLGAMGTTLANGHGFTQSFTEHGYIIGLVNVRADLTYQQGLRRMWSRKTRYDFYFPAFATLGEQAVLRKEIYCTGDPANDEAVFGYQERWAEYRYQPPEITSLFRSTTAGSLDGWHLAQRFNAAPVLGDTFIQENPPMDRVLAVGAAANGQHFIADMFFDIRAARPLPLYSVPGLIDHF